MLLPATYQIAGSQIYQVGIRTTQAAVVLCFTTLCNSDGQAVKCYKIEDFTVVGTPSLSLI